MSEFIIQDTIYLNESITQSGAGATTPLVLNIALPEFQVLEKKKSIEFLDMRMGFKALQGNLNTDYFPLYFQIDSPNFSTNFNSKGNKTNSICFLYPDFKSNLNVDFKMSFPAEDDVSLANQFTQLYIIPKGVPAAPTGAFDIYNNWLVQNNQIKWQVYFTYIAEIKTC